MRPQSGFTIVELLIVVVVIAILAAITIITYGAISARANTSSASNAAASVARKALAYYNETGSWPATSSVLTGAASSTSYYINSSSFAFDATALSSSNLPTKPAELNFYKCGTGATTAAPTTAAGVTTQTGVRIDYWSYTGSAVANSASGTTSGMIGTYNVGCGLST